MENFEGWYKPEKSKTLSEDQAKKLYELPRVQFINGRIESFLGNNVDSLAKEGLKIKSLVNPSILRSFIKQTATENKNTPWQVIKEIRQLGVDNPQMKKEIEKKYQESITYVGCIHGGDEKFLERAWQIADNPPENMIFMGDIIGTPKFRQLQKLFYNYVNNHSKNEILKDNPQASDQEILNYIGSKPPEPGLNLKQGYLELFTYEQELCGKSPQEIDEKIKNLTDEKIASEIKRLAKFAHYGHYASNLPENAKKTLANGVIENLNKLIGPIKVMQDKGCNVVIIEGNWDARAPIDFVPGADKPIPLAKEKRLFNLSEYLKKENISFYDKLTTLKTKTSLHVLAPFDSIINAPQLEKEKLQVLKNNVEKARLENKTIVLVGHGEPNWEMHNLPFKDSEAKGEHAQLIEGYKLLISSILPDEVIYDHMHDRIVDSTGQIVDANYKYIIESKKINEAELVGDNKNIGKNIDKQTVATYVPFRQTAEGIIDKRGSRKIKGVGGERQPTKVIISYEPTEKV